MVHRLDRNAVDRAAGAVVDGNGRLGIIAVGADLHGVGAVIEHQILGLFGGGGIADHPRDQLADVKILRHARALCELGILARQEHRAAATDQGADDLLILGFVGKLHHKLKVIAVLLDAAVAERRAGDIGGGIIREDLVLHRVDIGGYGIDRGHGAGTAKALVDRQHGTDSDLRLITAGYADT